MVKVVVGQNTIVRKVTVGTPLRVGSAANGSLTGLDDVNGSINLADGTILRFDSASQKFVHTTLDSAVSANVKIVAGDNITYDSATGLLSSRPQVVAGNNITYDSATGVISSTAVARSDDSIASVIRTLISTTTAGSGSGSLSYNSANGEFTFTPVSDSDIRGKLSATKSGGFGNLTYDNSTGGFTYTGVDSSSIRGLFSASGDIQYNASTGTFSFSDGASFSDGQARAAISVNHASGFGSISYDANTGVITTTGADDSNVRAAISVTDNGGFGSLSYDSPTGILTYTGPTNSDMQNLISATESNGSLGQLRYDASSGAITFALGIDSVRAQFSVINENQFNDSHGLEYDSLTGIMKYKGPSPINFRNMLSIDSSIDQSLGFGRFSYFAGDSIGFGGKFRYVAPTADSIFSVFKAGVGIDYDSATGTFSTDSQADVVFRTLTVSDSVTHLGVVSYSQRVAFTDSVSFNVGLITDSIISPNETITIDPKNDDSIAGTVIIKGTLDVEGDFRTNDPLINLGINSLDSNSVDGGGFVLGGLTDSISFLYSKDSNQFISSRGITARGPFQGPTIDRIDSAIDALPDSAQVRGLISTDGNGLSYNSTTGVISFDSSADVTVNTLRGPANFILDPAAVGDNTGTVQILGNLQVEGTTTTINSTTVSINDKNLVLADSAPNPAAADSSGLYIGGAAATFLYKAADDRWVANKPLQTNQIYADSFYGTVSSIANFSTDSLSEGPTNLYYTDTRVRAAISGGAGLTYVQGTGQFLIPSSGVTAGIYGNATNVPQVTVDSLGFVDSITNIPISTVNNFAFDSTNGTATITTATDSYSTVITLDPFNTTNLVEGGNNYYFTNARRDSAFNRVITNFKPDTNGTRNIGDSNYNWGQLHIKELHVDSIRMMPLKVGGLLSYDSASGSLSLASTELKQLFATVSDDSFGDVRWDANYGFRLDSDAIMEKTLMYGDSINTANDYQLIYSSQHNALRKISVSQLGNRIGGGGATVFGFINL